MQQQATLPTQTQSNRDRQHRPSQVGIRLVIQIACVAIGYVITAKIALGFSYFGPAVSPFFLPIGIALAAFILVGYRLWPGVWVGAMIVHLQIGFPLITAGAISTGNTIAPLVAAWLLKRTATFDPRMTRVSDALWFIAIGVVGSPLISATIGATAICIWNHLPWHQLLAVWRIWWLGDATGALLATPPLLGLFTLSGALPIPISKQIETWGLVIATSLACLLIFGARLDFAPNHYPISYLPFPVLIWAAMRFGLVGSSLTSLTISFSAVWGTKAEIGPFHHADPLVALGLVSTYILFVASPTLLLRTLFTERKNALDDLNYRAKFEHLITNISTRFVNIPSSEIDREICLALETLGRFCDVDRSYVFQLHDDTTVADNTYEWCSKWATPQIQNLQNIRLQDALPWFTRKLLRQELVYIPDVANLPPEAETDRAHLQAQDIQSLITVPMTSAGSLIGFLGFDSVRSNKAWANDVIPLLRIIGETFVSALQRKRAERNLLAAHDQLETRVRDRTAELSEANRRLKHQIAERRQAEQELDRFFNLAPEMICIAGTDGYFKRLNPAFERILGHSRKELLSRPYIDFVHPDDRRHTQESQRRIEKGKNIGTFNNRYRCLDGSYRHFSWVTLSLIDEQIIYATARDVTQQVLAQEALEESERRYRNLFEQSPISIWEQDFTKVGQWLVSLRAQGITDLIAYLNDHPEMLKHAASLIHTHDVNDASIRFYEANGKQDIIHRLDTIFQSESFHSLREELLAIWDGRNLVEHETTGETLKGRRTHKLVQWSAPKSNGKINLSKVIVAITDITERILAEQAVRQSERLASIGTLAAGIAHEINNPLGSILLNSQFASTKIKSNGKSTELRDCLKDITGQAKRASRIVKGVLQFSRQQDSQMRLAHIDEPLRNACFLARSYAQARDVPIDLNIPDRPPKINMNPTEIEQVFVNLVKNAIDASGPASAVHVSLRRDTDNARVVIQDHGEGMTEDQLNRAFDPFYSTRHDTGGTGLGLSITHGIITQHQGQIDIDSTPDVGTTVTVTLPITSADQP